MTSSEKKDSAVEFTWRVWIICGLLLSASAINYLDRQTLSSASVRITEQFELSEEQYGQLEAWFGYAFAIGSVIFGFVSDMVSVRWLYPIVLLLWSAVGFATGFCETHFQLLVCRTLLGFFEAGHWPCGIKAVRGMLSGRGRSLGNGLLQSGTSLGAIATPLLMNFALSYDETAWRWVFQVVGATGVLWIIGWFLLTRAADFQVMESSHSSEQADPTQWWEVIFSRRMLVILIVVALINTNWQILRAWMPKFLQQGRGYSQNDALIFTSIWFLATDVGCLGAGALATMLGSRMRSLFWSRWLVFFLCVLCCLTAATLPFLQKSPWLLVVLAVMGAGSLGVFPVYHAFSQDVSGKHQGKITGIAGIAAWGLSFTQQIYGRMIDKTGAYDWGLFIFACLPLVAAIVLLVMWRRDDDEPQRVSDTAGH